MIYQLERISGLAFWLALKFQGIEDLLGNGGFPRFENNSIKNHITKNICNELDLLMNRILVKKTGR
jgi:hypothetical protein